MDYFLIDNPLTPDPKDRVAIVTGVKTFDATAIIRRMKLRGNLLTETDMRAAIFAYEDEIGLIVEEGGGINTNLFNAQPSIAGKFDNANDTFDPSRHKLNYNLSFTKSIREKAAKIKTHKVVTPENGPVITAIRYSVSGLIDGTLSAGSTLEITGVRLKVFTEMDDNGVYFVARDGAGHKAATLVENKPSRLIALLPPLPGGTYTLEVRTNFMGVKAPGKQLRKVQYSQPLTM